MTDLTNPPAIEEGLLPCPFCGGTNIDAREDGSPFSIRCTDCCAEMPYMSLDDPQSVRWNTRASVTNPDVERLRHKLRMIVSHATGGHSQDIDASINDICVRISENRNHVFAHGKEVGERETRAALADRP
jgi:hypothetical protein